MASKKDNKEISNFTKTISNITKSFSNLSSDLKSFTGSLTNANKSLVSFTDALTNSIKQLSKTLATPATPTAPTQITPQDPTDKGEEDFIRPEEPKPTPQPQENNEVRNFIGAQLKLSALIFALSKAVNSVSDFQATAARVGFLEPSKILSKSIDKLVPTMTDLNVRSSLLNLGLEDNTQGIGRYLARSDLLGENIQNIGTNIRGFSLSLGLSTDQQSEFTKTIADSALTYNTSTEKLVASVASFAEKIAITSMLGNTTTVKAFTSLEAQVQRFLPEGTLEKFFGPFLSGGLETQTETAFLGIEDSVRRLTSLSNIQDSARSLQDLKSVISTINQTGQDFARSFGSLGSREFTETIKGILPTVGPEIFVIARQIEDALAKVTPADMLKQANLEQTNKILRALGDRLLEPLALIGRGLLAILDSLGSLASYVISGLVVGSIVNVGRILGTFMSGVTQKLQEILIAIKTPKPVASGGRGASGAVVAGAAGGATAAAKRTATTRTASRAASRGLARAASGTAARGMGSKAFSFLGGWWGIGISLLLTFLPNIISALSSGNSNTDEIKKNTGDLKSNQSLLSNNEAELASRAALLNRLIEVNRDSRLASTSDLETNKIVLQEQANAQLARIEETLKDLGKSIQTKSLMRK